MFGIDIFELVLIAIVFIIFVRPEDIPTLFKNLGRVYRSLQQMYHSFLDEMGVWDTDLPIKPKAPEHSKTRNEKKGD